MNVKELIAVLQKLPEDYMVLVDGYEDGLNELIDSSIIKVELNHYKEWYYGPHKINETSKTKAIYLHTDRKTKP